MFKKLVSSLSLSLGLVVLMCVTATSYAMPSVQVFGNTWYVSGEKDLRDEHALIDQRNCDKHIAHGLVDTCIGTNGVLVVTNQGWTISGDRWHYSIK